MFGPGAYRPIPPKGLPRLQICHRQTSISRSRNDKRQPTSTLWARSLSGQAGPADAARLGQSRPVVSA